MRLFLLVAAALVGSITGTIKTDQGRPAANVVVSLDSDFLNAGPGHLRYARDFMSQPVLGPVNIAYLFALSQFFMAWTIAWLYMRAAARFDEMGKRILEHLDAQKKKETR